MNYRHGDLSFHLIDVLFKAECVGKSGYVLARGEHTDHKHVIEGDVEIYKDETGRLFVKIEGMGTITHEEHKPITLPPGTYEMKHEQEFDYFLNEAVRVLD